MGLFDCFRAPPPHSSRDEPHVSSLPPAPAPAAEREETSQQETAVGAMVQLRAVLEAQPGIITTFALMTG